MTISVMLCGDGLSTDEREQLAGPAVRVVPGLCRDLASIADVERNSTGLVLGLHPDQVADAEMQAQIRGAGLDPLGVPVVNVGDFGGNIAGLRTALAGLIARVVAYPGSTPAHAKPVFPNRFSRRTLFTIPQPAYGPAPAIDSLKCAAGDGCSLCVGVCPQQAYSWAEGRIIYDKDLCRPCGVCVTACPTGAISNPAATPAAIAAQIEAVTVAAMGPVGVAFHCREATVVPADEGWQPIEVPCTGMVTAQWAVAPLLIGAARVAVLPCSTTGCDRGLDGRAEAAVDFAGELLTALGIATDRVALKTSRIAHEPLPAVPVDDPFDAAAAARVYAGLRTVGTSDEVMVAGDGANVGTVTIDSDTCTMCTMCSQRCPTGALAAGYSDDRALTISFDAMGCTGCDQCVSVCPEVERGAITVDHGVDFAALAAGRIELNRSATHICERCGQPVAPTAMMDRFGEILGGDAALMSQLTTLCLACRGS